MSPQSILNQLQSHRLHWLDMPCAEGTDASADATTDASTVRIQLDTPSQFLAARIVAALRGGDGDTAIDLVSPLARAWQGVTEAFLLGHGVGSAAPVECHPRLVAIVLGDRPEWLTTVAMKAVELARDARLKVEATSGN